MALDTDILLFSFKIHSQTCFTMLSFVQLEILGEDISISENKHCDV